MKKIVMLLVVLIGMVLVQGCVTAPTQLEIETAYYGECPENYKKLIKDYCENIAFDPESIQYKFEQPHKGWIGKDFGWMVYFSLNAKNRFGGYVGFTPYQALLRDNKLIKCEEQWWKTMFDDLY